MTRFFCILFFVSVASAQSEIVIDALIDGSNTQLRRPAAFAIGVGGLIYVADAGNNRLVAVDSIGKIVLESSKGSSNSELRWPIDVTVGSNGRVYVADSGNRRIVEFSRLLEWKGELNVEDENKNALEPRLVVGSSVGDLFVYESDNGQLLRFDSFFNVVARLGGQTGNQLGTPIALCYSPIYGVLWIDSEDNGLNRCDAFLSDPHSFEAFGRNTSLRQISAVDSTLFGVGDSMLYRRDGNLLDSLGFSELLGIAPTARDIQIEASSRTDLYLLNLRTGTLHRLYWP